MTSKIQPMVSELSKSGILNLRLDLDSWDLWPEVHEIHGFECVELVSSEANLKKTTPSLMVKMNG